MANSDGGAPKAMTKTDILNSLAESSGMEKKLVLRVLDDLSELIGKNLKDGGPGVFTIPGLVKIKVQRKPAQPERDGIDPFTKQPRKFPAKPARNVVKAQPLKALKDMV